jgi:hypothetical protein
MEGSLSEESRIRRAVMTLSYVADPSEPKGHTGRLVIRSTGSEDGSEVDPRRVDSSFPGAAG